MVAPAHLIDLTRLVSRLGQPALTGIDRVERAWLTHLLTLQTPLFALVRTVAGCLLLPRAGAQAVADWVGGQPLPDRVDLLSRLTRRDHPLRGRAETALRPLALAALPRPLLGGALRRHLPQGTLYLNLGHANLSRPMMRALRAGPGLRLAVLLHDTIPLDHPEYCRADMPRRFRKRLAAIAAHADLVIHLTEATRQWTEAHLARLGRVPPGITAPLGVTPPAPDPAQLSPGLDLSTPYFVALGTIEPRKNLGLLLDVWADLAKAGPVPRLYVLGNRGWADPALLHRLDARPPGISEIAGLPDGAVQALLAGSRALLFPSLAEGFGLPPLEAAALGVPVLATDLAPIREMLQDYPVYLPGSDRYPWVQTVRLAWQAPARNGPSPALPRWDDHFRAVLTGV